MVTFTVITKSAEIVTFEYTIVQVNLESSLGVSVQVCQTEVLVAGCSGQRPPPSAPDSPHRFRTTPADTSRWTLPIGQSILRLG